MNKTFHLYVGMAKNLDAPTQQRMIDTINERHPDAVASEILDGYWSGVEETTLLIKVVTKLEHVQETANILKSMVDGFVAIDEPED